MQNVDRVRKVISEALYMDVNEIAPDANLVRDLGAESLDFLDIMFRLEKEFSISLPPKGEFERQARGSLSEDEFATDGLLSDAALTNLRRMFPETGGDILKPGLMLREIPTLFTVQTFVKLVEAKLAGDTSALGFLTGDTASPALG